MKENFRNFYEIIKKIGQGRFGTIYEVKDKKTKEKRAIKLIEKSEILSKYKKEDEQIDNNKVIDLYMNGFINEINLTKTLENENVVKFYEYFNTDDELVIVMELCDSNLLDIISKYTFVYAYFRVIFSLNDIFKKMFKEKIVHGNLRLENILIKYLNRQEDKYFAKLKFSDDIYTIKEFPKTFENESSKSRIKYIAPEILKGEEYNEKSDLWSLGIIYYKIAYNKFPFNGESENEILDEIKKTKQIIQETNIDNNIEDLINKLLQENPQKRISWEEYFNHPIFN